jgi:hypothetical protein
MIPRYIERMPRPAFRRTILTASLLLLVGASVNVAVAWGIAANVQIQAWCAGTRWTPGWVVIPPGSVWNGERGAAWNGDIASVELAPSYRYAESRAGLELPDDGGTIYLRVLTLCTGWPAHSLRAAWVEPKWLAPVIPLGNFGLASPAAPPLVGVLSSSPEKCTVEGMMPPEILRRHGLFTRSGETARIPTRPLLAAFILNTFFYAAILALPLSFFPIRGRLRARRGRCPTCGYDLAGLADAAAPCPECDEGVAEWQSGKAPSRNEIQD